MIPSNTGHNRRHAFRRPVAWGVSVIFFCLTAVVGCGHKAPPLPPVKEMPPVIHDLRISTQGDTVILNWSLPQTAASQRVAGFFVYRSQSPISEKCDTCPRRYERIAKVPFYSGISPVYRDTVTPGNIYHYKVTCYTAGGTESGDSNAVSCTLSKKTGNDSG